MDLNNILLLIVAGLNLVLGFLVFSRNTRSMINITYSLVVIAAASWAVGLVMFRISDSLSDALFWARFYYIAAAFIAYAFLLFGFVFPYPKGNINMKKAMLLLLPFFGISILTLTPYHIESLFIQPWGKDVILGWSYALYTVYFLIYMGSGFWLMLIKGVESVGIRKMQVRYVIVGTLVATLGGATLNLIFPLFGNYRYIWLGPIFTVIMIIFIAYAVARYRLMDIRLVVTRILKFILLLITGIVFVEMVFLSFHQSIIFLQDPVLFIIAFILALLSVTLFGPFERLYARLTQGIFFSGQIDYQIFYKELSKTISTEVSREGLVYSISKSISQRLALRYVKIYVYDENNKRYSVLGSNQTPLGAKHTIVKKLNSDKEVLVTEELERRQNDTPDQATYIFLSQLIESLQKLGIFLAAPIIIENSLVGIIALGQKKSGDFYTREEIGFFEVLAPQMATALEKARLYDEAKQFAVKLKKEVEEATEELKKANIHLKQLDLAKSEFLSIAAHQLRTPVTGIKGYLSMFLEGDFGKFTGEQKAEIKKLFDSSDRLSRLIDVFLNVSRIESGRFELKKAAVDFSELTDDVIDSLSHQAEMKKIKMSLQKPSEAIPRFDIDKDKIHDVLMNLVDNAIKYTPKGGWVNVRVDASKNLVNVQVRDNGIGIEAKDIDKLFTKFSRADVASRIHTGGSGLGLYIAKKIVEAHGGKIWVESEGKDQGSTFFFTLPIILEK